MMYNNNQRNIIVYINSGSDVLLVTSLVCFGGLLLSFHVINSLRFVILLAILLGIYLYFLFMPNPEILNFIFLDPRVSLIDEFFDSLLDILSYKYNPSSFFHQYSQFHNPFFNMVHWGGVFGLSLVASIIFSSIRVMLFGGQPYFLITALLLARSLTDSVILYTPEGLLFYAALLSNRKAST